MNCVSGESKNNTFFSCLRERKKSQTEKDQIGLGPWVTVGFLIHDKKHWKQRPKYPHRESRAFTSLGRQISKGKWCLPSYCSKIYQQTILHRLHSPWSKQVRVLTLSDALHMETLSQGKGHPLPQTSSTSKHLFQLVDILSYKLPCIHFLLLLNRSPQLILLHFWRSEMYLTRPKSRGRQSCIPTGSRGQSISCLFQILKAHGLLYTPLIRSSILTTK